MLRYAYGALTVYFYYATHTLKVNLHSVRISIARIPLQPLGINILQENDVKITCLNYRSSIADLLEKDKQIKLFIINKSTLYALRKKCPYLEFLRAMDLVIPIPFQIGSLVLHKTGPVNILYFHS